MNKSKKKALILGGICLVILVVALGADLILSRSYLKEIKYNEVINKIEKKESFVLLFSQTTCTHCMDFKPKLERVANKYKLDIYYLQLPFEFFRNFRFTRCLFRILMV